jgi:hypothetical protein
MFARVPDYDLTTAFVLWLFGSFAIGGLVCALAGRLFGFETGMGIGLLVPGVVSLSFTLAFFSEYLDFRDAPDRTTGRVVAVEQRAVNAAGDVTTPVAIVEYESRAGETLRAESKAASGFDVGESVVVVRGALGPRVAQPSQLFGGAIASLLFGTFPLSAGVFFLVSAVANVRERRAKPRPEPGEKKLSPLTIAANLVIFAGLVVPSLLDWDALRSVTVAFGVASLGLWMHVGEGIARKRDVRWWLGVGVVAINFSVWSLALWLLAPDAAAGW